MAACQRGMQEENRVKAISSPPLFLALSSQGAAGSEEKGLGWEARADGREWGLSSPPQAAAGPSSLVRPRGSPQRSREAADLLDQRT